MCFASVASDNKLKTRNAMKNDDKKPRPAGTFCRTNPRPDKSAAQRPIAPKKGGKVTLRELEQQVDRINPDPDSLDRG